jgi:tetratricopeptide (TPR) repeat protein
VHPARQYLGSVLLKAKKYADAERVYKEDLVINPHNGWSLTGLTIALQKQNKKEEAAKVKAEAATAFARADIKITDSVF